MKGVNLIPEAKKRALARHRRLRLWSWAVGGYVLLLVMGLAVSYAHWPDAVSGSHDQLEVVSGQIDRTRGAIADLNKAIGETRMALHASRILAEVPDFSVLLEQLARHLGPQMVLDRCELEPHPPASIGAQAPAPGATLGQWKLHMGGVARSQSAVSQFAIRLESTGLFDQVAVVETKRKAYLGQMVIGFAIECTTAAGASSP